MQCIYSDKSVFMVIEFWHPLSAQLPTTVSNVKSNLILPTAYSYSLECGVVGLAAIGSCETNMLVQLGSALLQRR